MHDQASVICFRCGGDADDAEHVHLLEDGTQCPHCLARHLESVAAPFPRLAPIWPGPGRAVFADDEETSPVGAGSSWDDPDQPA